MHRTRLVAKLGHRTAELMRLCKVHIKRDTIHFHLSVLRVARRRTISSLCFFLVHGNGLDGFHSARVERTLWSLQPSATLFQ